MHVVAQLSQVGSLHFLLRHDLAFLVGAFLELNVSGHNSYKQQ
jgi:hypothetical protein